MHYQERILVWLSISVLVLFIQPISALELVRGPYLQSTTSSKTILCFRTSEVSTVKVEFTDGFTIRTISSTARDHTVNLTNLKTDKRYKYKILSDGKLLAGKYSFRTAPPQNGFGTLRGAVIGDSGKAGQAQNQVIAQMQKWKPDILIHVGDIVYPNGADEDYDLKFFQPLAKLLRSIPFFPCIGNHDAQSLEVYLKNYVLPERSGTERYYTYRYGPVQFIVIDSNLNYLPGSEQYQWLEKVLKARKRKSEWRVAYMHHPAFSSGKHGDTIDIQKYLVPLFKRRVNLVLSGHDHIYDRSMVGEGAGRKVPYIVSGGGGTDLFEVVPKPNSSVALSAHHFVAFKAFKGTILKRLRVKAISSQGQILDSLVAGK